MQSFGAPELIIILVIIVVLFGVGRVSKIGKELGTAISEFRKGLNEGKEGDTTGDEEKTA